MSNFRALIVGAGGMGRAWGRNLHDHPDTDIVGWVDIVPERAWFAVDELKLTGVYAGPDLGKALAETRPDFVVDVTSPEAHYEVTMQALGAGLPVLGEKPMATSMEQARAMIGASERTNKLFMVSQSRRYDPRLTAYRGLIDQYLGPVGILKSDFFLGAHFGGFRDQMPHVLVLDMAIHTFDAARYLTGADPVSVYCEEYNPTWSWYRGASSATALFDMAGGLRYLYTGSWCADGSPTSWESEWRAVGPHGTAIWDGVDSITADVVVEHTGFLATTATHYGHPIEMHHGIAGSLREFLTALRTGQTPQGECHDNIKSLAMVFGAIESASTGQRVNIDVRCG